MPATVTKITADGGFADQYPADTLIAFEKAVERGAERLELDVHFSKDRRLVLHHFYNLGTTNNGEGLVFTKESAYLRTLDAGSWYSETFKGQRIPFLEEVFEAIGSRVEYEIHLIGFSLDFLDTVFRAVDKYGLMQLSEFTSFHHFLLANLKRLRPDARVGIFESQYPDWMSLELGHALTKATLQLGEIDVAHCPVAILTPAFVRELQESGLKVHGSNCDSEEDLRKAYSLRLDQLSTSHLELALRVRAAVNGLP